MRSSENQLALEFFYNLQKTASVKNDVEVEEKSASKEEDFKKFASFVIESLSKIAEDIDQDENFEASNLIDEALNVIVNRLSQQTR